MNSFKKMCEELEASIIDAYESGVSLEDAERLAAKFLHGQILVSQELKAADLSARMRKSGLKAVKAAVYTDACSKADKKPTESQLEHTINMNELVSNEQDALDQAEVDRDSLERYYNVFREGHVYMRGVAKGRFDG